MQIYRISWGLNGCYERSTDIVNIYLHQSMGEQATSEKPLEAQYSVV